MSNNTDALGRLSTSMDRLDATMTSAGALIQQLAAAAAGGVSSDDVSAAIDAAAARVDEANTKLSEVVTANQPGSAPPAA